MTETITQPNASFPGIVSAKRYTAQSDSLAKPGIHHHIQGQLVLSLQGIVACEVAGSHWIVPPHCALWVPAGLAHQSRASANALGYFLFIDASVGALPQGCCTFSISAMLREMIIELCGGRANRSAASTELLSQLLLDELSAMPRINTHFPIPSDPRLQRMAEALISTPGDRKTIKQWSAIVGMSERTLARHLFEQTGMSFGKWRRQLHLMVALELLTEGCSVQQVAGDLGYEAVTSFITMFKQAFGTTPAKYASSRSMK
ncbi:helix-turn-helix transcriptional regulator [Shimwellia pseudoproteus]|uniref:AraC family transcriptional regulator n=1 Tax=Shimwellia pseudoproteus TaxID=570012 RepID=UPI0018EDCF9F|nr:helix-turn-helix transcriptional regulator [Shimwellia pseudoproteus]MBJ3816637.1 helix-turn-helix transcriptional regulator [Shimwellia pseudoproteus]